VSQSDSPTDDIVAAFGRAVRIRRKEIGLSQELLADRAHLHRTYIAEIERGCQNIALRNIARLAGALEITVPELFERVSRISVSIDPGPTQEAHQDTEASQ
jgi:transcriptional regulator with XRE-family HTH domain